MPINAELEELQKQYEQELNAILDRLYQDIDKYSTVSEPRMTPEPISVGTPVASPKSSTSEKLPGTESAEKSPFETPQATTKPSEPISPETEPKPEPTMTPKPWPGFIGGIKNLWKHIRQPNLIGRLTRPLRRAWYDDPTREHTNAYPTLQEYLAFEKEVENCIEYYVVMEAVHPELQKAFDRAKQSIKDLLKRYFLQVYKFGNAALEEPTSTTSPSPSSISPSTVITGTTTKRKKAHEVQLIDNPIEIQKDIIRDRINNNVRFQGLEPFEPWTWFKWSSKPKGGANVENAKEKLLEQWRQQAGKQFTNNFSGLINLFAAIKNGYFGEGAHTNDGWIRKAVGTLMGLPRVDGQPWKWFVEQFKEKYGSSSEIDIARFIDQHSKQHSLPHRYDKIKQTPQPGEEQLETKEPEKSSSGFELPPDAKNAYNAIFGGDNAY